MYEIQAEIDFTRFCCGITIKLFREMKNAEGMIEFLQKTRNSLKEA